ncbi:hypothetical protein M413DRAFT_224411 [Hebeloma cylindrosporum]|uniref:Transmembrane protein 135 N-terminal domain-containing protein n=1 Tax=Hebeloma cylindrosporum TaxID=76867 RepID=A0A0C3CWI7_HEBCY|nr:hypothetical protein M413DRAFT_224411 [Hebeloma cylindrosporum h7]
MSKTGRDWLKHVPTLPDDPTHPAQIALRTYAVALSLSLGPSIVPFITAILFPKARSSSRTDFEALKRVLRRELGHDGFAFAITLSVAGGAALRQHLWCALRDQDQHENPNSTGTPDKQNSNNSNLFSSLADISNSLKGCVSWLTPVQQTFISYLLSSTVGIFLIQAGRERTSRLNAQARSSSQSLTSPTLDLTLLVLVRALDSLVQTFILRRPVSPVGASSGEGSNHAQKTRAGVEPQLVYERLEKEKVKRENDIRQQWTSQVDAFVFWACSARIMWCFFYEPQRLPRSYVKWINTLANLDGRIIDVLKHIRKGTWSYIAGSPQHHRLLQASAVDLGLPAAWGDPTVLPAYGGSIANEAWKKLGVFNRPGVGGIPCEILHAEVGSSLGLTSSCTANASLRTLKGFVEALAIYLPVHFLPVLLTRPQILMRPHRLLQTLGGAVRSATFLSSFIGLYWYTVCLTRSLVLAKLFPFVSHDFWDGPFGCILAGSLACGSSIWIENGRRRGEMALYVLPRAVRACLPDAWIKSGNRGVKLAERMAFILSTSTLLTAAIHRPDSLRGLSRWTLAFVTNGPNAGFWKRKRQDPSMPATPSIPPTPFLLPQVR